MKGRIEKLNERLKNREISALELTKSYLDKVKIESLNSFITITEEAAIENAKRADALFIENKATLLTGIPMSLKDNLSSKGIKTTAGSKVLSEYIPTYDAHTYECLLKEGAVLLGKNNMDEFGMGANSDTSFKGAVKNFLDEKRTPGGSSGGSAASVASNLSVYALGSDTGGSVRLPSSYMGTVGLCPTYGALSRRGLIAHSSYLDRVGVIASTVSDAAIVFDSINSHDEKDMTNVKRDKISAYAELKKGIKGLKIGAVTSLYEKAHKDTKKCLEKAIKVFSELGATVEEAKISGIEKSNDIYSVISTSDAASNLGRYDGVRYGIFGDSVKDARSYFGDEVRMRILLGNAVLTSEKELNLRKKAEAEAFGLYKSFSKAFGKFDVLIAPSSFHDAPIAGENNELLSDEFLTPSSVARIPSLSMPMGFSENNMPLGLQIMGDKFSEDVILKVAYTFEEAMGKEIYKEAENFEF